MARIAGCVLCLTALGGAPVAAAAQTEIPTYPWVTNDTMVVDEVSIQSQAASYCAAEPEPSAIDFYLGALPYDGFDALCLDDGVDVETVLGDLYISGYFGGLWLRDALYADGERRLPLPVAGLQSIDSLRRMAEDPHRTSATQAMMLRVLTRASAMPLDRAQTGVDGEVVISARGALPGLLGLYGYNLGYIEVLLDNPPEGVEDLSHTFDCSDAFLDCSSQDIELEIFDTYEPVISSMESPDSVRWRRVAALVDTYGVPAVESGAAVWEDILAEDDIVASAYELLVDVSIGFLMVTDAAALSASKAWGDGDAAAARCALRVEAGLIIWAGSYFMGLASDDPAGTFPTLECD